MPLKLPKWALTLFVVAALVGFSDSAYLTAQHVRGVIPPCGVLNNCETVLTSAYATITGIPVAAFGVFYYGLLIVLLIAFFDTGDRRILHVMSWIVTTGVLATLYFIYVQAFIINAWCPYCLVSATMTGILFALSVYIMRID